MINLIFYIILSYNSCIIFFTGGSNIMPLSLYSEFLYPIKKYPIYKYPFIKNNINNKIINKIKNKYENIIYIGHSSGCTTAINNCNNKVKKLILLDPVKTPNYNNINIDYVNNIYIINAEKSYKWSIVPPFIPFIPILKLFNNDINIDSYKITNINVKNYGHCDIIDNPWRDLMHNLRISRGNENRNNFTISKYHKYIQHYI